MAETKYSSVSDMLAHNAPSDEFRKDFETQIAARKVVKQLIALRATKGMSQKDIADQMKCSQSRVSKLENGTDDDMRLGDLRAYAKALGFSTGFLFSDRKMTTVEAVKQHAFCVKQLLDRMAHLAGRDEVIAQAVSAFFGEAFFNMVKIIQDSASKLPLPPDSDSPYIQIGIANSVAEQIALGPDCDVVPEEEELVPA